MNFCMNGQGHITKVAVMAINRKIFKNILLQNQKANDCETWHEASGNVALQSLYKPCDPGITLTYFTARLTKVANAFE